MNKSSIRLCFFLFALSFSAEFCGCRHEGKIPVLSSIGEYKLDASAPEGLSGITWTGNDSYLFIEDSGGRIHNANVSIDTTSGAITGCKFTSVRQLPAVTDGEGIAYDNGTSSFFVTDESGPKILNVQDSQTALTTAITIPEPLKHIRPNKSLESLSLGTDAQGHHVLWTANEDALTIDGETASATNSALIRIFAIQFTQSDANNGKYESWLYSLDAAQGESLPGLPYKLPFTGVADIAALGDGKLLVMERSCGVIKLKNDPDSCHLITIRIYYADTAKTKPGSKTPLEKKLLWEQSFPNSNYEGITLGPKLNDGTRSVILVADGDVNTTGSGLFKFTFAWAKALYALKLQIR